MSVHDRVTRIDDPLLVFIEQLCDVSDAVEGDLGVFVESLMRVRNVLAERRQVEEPALYLQRIEEDVANPIPGPGFEESLQAALEEQPKKKQQKRVNHDPIGWSDND